MLKKKYLAGHIRPGTKRFEACVKKYGPLEEKTVEAKVEEVIEPVEAVEEVIEAVEEVIEPKKAAKKVKKTTKKKTEE